MSQSPVSPASPVDTRAADDIPLSELKETPLQKKQVFAIFCVLLSEGLCSSMLLPFVGLYVAHLRDIPVNDAGYFSGFLVGCFMFGQVVSARLWGWVSDQYGRRFPLICGLFLSGIAMLGFGLSSNIWICTIFRFLHGLFNGNVLVGKTMMSDITDRTNISRGFSLVSITFTLGFSLGPVVGGFLYDPCSKWGSVFGESGFFVEYPAFLPSLFIFLYTLFAAFITSTMVKESNPHAKPLPKILRILTPCLSFQTEPFVPHPNPSLEAAERGMHGREEEDFDVNEKGVENEVYFEDERDFDKMSLVSLKEDYLVNSGFVNHPEEHDFLSEVGPKTGGSFSKRRKGDKLEPTLEIDFSSNSDAAMDEEKKKETFGYLEAFKAPVLRVVLTQYMLLASSEFIIKECFPLWAIATEDVLGLSLSSTQISIIMLLNSTPCIVANAFFPKLSRKYNNQLGIFRLGSGVASASIFLFTLPPMFLPRIASIVLCVILLCTTSFFMTFCFSLNSITTTKAAPPGHVGATMGIMQSCGAIARTITPFVVSPLFAFSISGKHIYPFNYALVFVVSAAFLAFLWYRSYKIRTTPSGRLEISDTNSETAI